MLGKNLYLTHLLPLLVNPWTIQAVYAGNTMTEIKHYLCNNRELMKTGILDNQGTERKDQHG